MPSLAAITEREINLVSGLVSLLRTEQDVLKRAEATALPEINRQKLEVIEQLNVLEISRGKILGATGNESIRAAMEHWLAGHPKEQLTADRWKKLMELAREAKQLHELNGKLVNMHLQQTNEMLAALNQNIGKNSLYGSDGQAAAATGSRIVDSA